MALTECWNPTGAQDDLNRVTQLAYHTVAEAGMSPRVGHLSFPLQRPEEAGKRPYSHWLAAEIDGEVRRLVAEAATHTEKLLRKNSHLLEKVRFVGQAEGHSLSPSLSLLSWPRHCLKRRFSIILTLLRSLVLCHTPNHSTTTKSYLICGRQIIIVYSLCTDV